MRREKRRRENTENKNVIYISMSILAIGIIAFIITFILYGSKVEEESNVGTEKLTALMQEKEEETKVVSTQIGKNIEETKKEDENIISENIIVDTKTTEKKETSNTTNTSNNNIINTVNSVKKEETAKNENKTVTFIKPVEGEISKEYAKDNLVYSETLEEWTTHLGIDIKAEKTTIVKSAADGKIKSIKNDPRYGLSVIIEHQDGYETLYANLLSSEFVQVGEEVKQGQSIGTVGNTATFEIVDETHLHFEITKNGESVDPTGLIK